LLSQGRGVHERGTAATTPEQQDPPERRHHRERQSRRFLRKGPVDSRFEPGRVAWLSKRCPINRG